MSDTCRKTFAMKGTLTKHLEDGLQADAEAEKDICNKGNS